MCHNPYFSRWFSAIKLKFYKLTGVLSHNPYFSRWFSAIQNKVNQSIFEKVTILILVDGFLQ